jgi:hypothetical protein
VQRVHAPRALHGAARRVARRGGAGGARAARRSRCGEGCIAEAAVINAAYEARGRHRRRRGRRRRGRRRQWRRRQRQWRRPACAKNRGERRTTRQRARTHGARARSGSAGAGKCDARHRAWRRRLRAHTWGRRASARTSLATTPVAACARRVRAPAEAAWEAGVVVVVVAVVAVVRGQAAECAGARGGVAVGRDVLRISPRRRASVRRDATHARACGGSGGLGGGLRCRARTHAEQQSRVSTALHTAGGHAGLAAVRTNITGGRGGPCARAVVPVASVARSRDTGAPCTRVRVSENADVTCTRRAPAAAAL